MTEETKIYVVRNHAITTIAEIPGDVSRGDNYFIDIRGEPVYVEVDSVYEVKDVATVKDVHLRGMRPYSLFHTQEKARNIINRRKARDDVRRKLDAIVERVRKERDYQYAADTDPEAASLYEEYLELKDSVD